MRVLFVDPVESGSGETVTTVHMGQSLASSQDLVTYIASPFAAELISNRFPGQVRMLSKDATHNRTVWERSLAQFDPDVVVFADYPLLFFSSGSAKFSKMEEWIRSLDDLDACLVTLDHFGFAQEPSVQFFGPPHLSIHCEVFPELPEEMHTLLPCPMHEPSSVPRRKGIPFRYHEVPLAVPSRLVEATRDSYLRHREDHLIFHSVPRWAIHLAESYGLPLYRFLGEILQHYLRDISEPVTIVSVNNGALLRRVTAGNVSIINLNSLSPSRYEALLLSCDLMLTENSASISLGKAVCGLVPCAVLVNSYRYRVLANRLRSELREIVYAMEAIRPGSVFPFEVFPAGVQDLDELILFKENTILQGIDRAELFGGETTRGKLTALLTDRPTRQRVQASQRAYVEKLARLPGAVEVLHELAD